MSELIYRTPANGDWNRALPIGNGRLGAMIYGEMTGEHYQLNEDSVWFGKERNRNNKDALPNLSILRELIFSGRIEEAERLCKYAFSGVPQSQHCYQSLGDVYFDFCGRVGEVSEYFRKLDIATAIHNVKITDRDTGISYARESFASVENNCISIRFSTDKKGALDLAASLQRDCFYETSEYEGNSLYIAGNLGGGGMDFCCGMKFVSDGSMIKGMGEHLITEGATEVCVYITALTEFRSKNPKTDVKKILDKAAEVSFDTWKEKHIKEYQSYYNRMEFCLSYPKEYDKLTTEERLKNLDDSHPDNGLLCTYMDYGRYLLLSSSRGECLPANLQGIWCNDIKPAWGSKYTININTEMNYWPAGICNLSECQKPLFDHLLRMLPKGQQTAKEMYGCRGFVAHHNTDMWGDTAPQDIYIPATYWVMGGAWLCTHIWSHYLYTMDLEFLKKMYPVIKEAVVFFMDFMVEKEGEYITCPSVSPENTYIMKDGTRGSISAGVTMDNEILHDLFEQFIKAANLIGEKDMEFVKQAEVFLKKIPPIKIGKNGQIMEWHEDYEEAEPGHRHISHLWGLHPSHQISMGETETLCQAAKVTLERRLQNGGGHTGWSRAWIINMYARLWEGEKCYENLLALLKKSTLPNLLDNHPPFQIDGNFGATAAMGEMILQAKENRVVLLPALPKAWETGLVRGICAYGKAEYTICWENHKLKKVTIYATADYKTILMYQTNKKEINLKAGSSITLEGCTLQ